MVVRFWHIPAMIVFVALLHFGAVWSGFYDWQFSTGVFWFDNVLHILVGVGFGMAALWVTEQRGLRLAFAARTIAVLGVVLVLALLWELAEYVFFTQFTEYAYWSKIYSPSLYEALSDVLSDLIGGVLLLAVAKSEQPPQ